ncbi:hypothetical protein BPNPMPFG_000861 [Mesorhizobium sp. AR07]|uniref:hypothetical protein n=1 Tax=Mesorhizobium sp. AR07 TaxID=2865838 RepID=UPI002160C9F7|nr:hypothetical protein [Mesorhizobium sp. AR07]UVK45334.1 hypothetical protein BPNPMPFG_000861 [Mesorhizobium sp. AR07]
MEQEIEFLKTRVAVLATRVGALEMLIETLLAERIGASPAFRRHLDGEYSSEHINAHLPDIPDEEMRGRVHLIGTNLSERLAGARRQSAHFARKRGRG